jgi:hypothetical protein
MRKTFAMGLMLAAATIPSTLFAAGAVASGRQTPTQTATQTTTGTINGVARTSDQKPISDCTANARDAGTGQVADTKKCTPAGAFVFSGLQPGSYVVEVVDVTGKIVALSPAVSVAAGTAVSVTVTSTLAAGAIAAAAGGGIGLLGLGTAATVAVIAAAGAVAIVAVNAAQADASPNQ